MATFCCPTGPGVVSNYSPKGNIVKMADVDVYISGTGTNALILIYDIFGLSPQAKQVCDKLAEAGFQVAIPDLFKGKPWKLEDFPPKDPQTFKDFLASNSFEDSVLPSISSVRNYMISNLSAEKFGLLGFCWGGSMTVQSCGTDLFEAGALVHYAFVTPELCEDVKVPLCLMPSGDEADHTPLKEVLDKKSFGAKCIYKRFDDMHHGFCAARGDWTQPLQAQRATEAIEIIADFMKKNME